MSKRVKSRFESAATKFIRWVSVWLLSQCKKTNACEVESLIRPFSVRDTLLVRALQDKGVSLDLEGTVLQPKAPIWKALLSQVPLNGYGAPTYVIRNGGQDGFIQAHQGRGPAEIYTTFMAPSLDQSDSTTWQQLLEALCRGEGEQGVQWIFAKLPAQAEAEVHVFRQVGFRVYTQEHIVRLRKPPAEEVSAGPIRLRAWESKDAWGVHRLYCMGAPRFVQQAEHLPGEIGEAATSDWAHGKHQEKYVWVQNSEIAAFVRLLIGELGHWLHVLVHPEQTEHAERLIRLSLARLARYETGPVYCAVRTYETDVLWALKAVGFEEVQARFLLVKQTAVHVRKKVFERLPQVEVEGVEAAPTASTRLNSRNKRDRATAVHSEVLRDTQ